jgi:hypothetical protein
MTPSKDHKVLIVHKIINEQPFLEFTIFDGTIAVDQTTLRPTQDQQIIAIISNWMYGYKNWKEKDNKVQVGSS